MAMGVVCLQNVSGEVFWVRSRSGDLRRTTAEVKARLAIGLKAARRERLKALRASMVAVVMGGRRGAGL